MQVLFRQFDGKYYVWKEATHRRKQFVVDGANYSEIDIIAVKGDKRGKYVRCRYCNEQIDNTPEAIEKHFLEQEAKRDCTKCGDMRIEGRSVVDRTIAKNAEGRYDIVEKYTARLHCCYSYQDPDTNPGKLACKYSQHRQHGVEAIGGILMEYPDLFEKQITVEALKANGCVFENRRHGFFCYNMLLRNTLFAYVNECGIVDHFEASYRNDWNHFYYSATQKKLFHVINGCYAEEKPVGWSDTKYNHVRRKIEALYKEDKAK